MNLIRVLEEYKKSDHEHIGQYKLNIDAQTIIRVLDDLVLNEDDYEDEIFDPYILSKEQVIKLYPFLDGNFNFDFNSNIYELMCYSE